MKLKPIYENEHQGPVRIGLLQPCSQSVLSKYRAYVFESNRSDADTVLASAGPFFDRIESAFIGDSLGSIDERGIPNHVETAIDDARSLTRDEFDDRADADLPTEVIPAFYLRVAEFHCRCRE